MIIGIDFKNDVGFEISISLKNHAHFELPVIRKFSKFNDFRRLNIKQTSVDFTLQFSGFL